MKLAAAVGTALIFVAIAANSAVAQSLQGDPRMGRELAMRLCAGCHAVDGQANAVVRADVPSFTAIAGRPGVTAERLAGAIIVPHPAMPGVQLTVMEIRDLIAYILSLRTQ